MRSQEQNFMILQEKKNTPTHAPCLNNGFFSNDCNAATTGKRYVMNN